MRVRQTLDALLGGDVAVRPVRVAVHALRALRARCGSRHLSVASVGRVRSDAVGAKVGRERERHSITPGQKPENEGNAGQVDATTCHAARRLRLGKDEG